MKTDEAQPAPTPETDEILEYLRVQFPATDGHIPLREKIEKLERECDKKDAQIKRLCEDWADDDTRIKAIAKTHGIEVESLSVEDGYFHTCVDVAEKMSEALTAKDAQIVALREALERHDKWRRKEENQSASSEGYRELPLCRDTKQALFTKPPAVVPLAEVEAMKDEFARQLSEKLEPYNEAVKQLHDLGLVPLEDVTPLVEAMEIVIPHLPSSAGIAKARHLAVKHGPTSDSYACRRAIESLATFTAKHPL